MADIISNVFDENEDFRALMVSDDECAVELQFQEVLEASLGIFHLHMSSTEVQESPESSQGFCDICMETKVTNEMFKLENCSDHSFCSDCIAQYVQSKIHDHIFPVTCPGFKCRATIEPVSCKSIIPEDVFEKWEGGLSESTLLDCEKFYCPYKDCSELLIYDQDQDIIECICPVCQRLLCAACGVPWHTGLDCDHFQKDEKNREDDLKVEELANNSKWMKCPHCKHIVQKADGCIHITCWMGRVRLSMKRVESNNNRQVTYCKRRSGILKKAHEICVLCHIDIILLMFSPTGKPTLFQGGQSNFDEIIAKFAQLTPQERAKRKLESLETLRKTFNKLDNDIGVQEFLYASDPSVEELHNQVRVLRSWLTDVEMRLNWWSNPDKINKVEDLTLMECALRESLNAVHVRKLQNRTHLHLLRNSELDAQTHPWHPANKIQHMPFPQAPNILPQGNMGYSRDSSVAESSHVLDSGKVDQARQAATAILDNSIFHDLNSTECLRQQLNEQYSYNPNDNFDLLERKVLDPQSDVNLKGYLMDYEFQRNFNLTRSVDSVNNSAADDVAVQGYDEKSYAQQATSCD